MRSAAAPRVQGLVRLNTSRRLSLAAAKHLAQQVAGSLPGAPWRRLLHISDLHNLPSGFRFARALAEELRPSVVVNTGDVSGWGPVVEALLVRRYLSFAAPHVFAPGNHDSRTCRREVARRGGLVLDEPRTVKAAGLTFWGFKDPNRTHLFGKPYDQVKCREAAKLFRPPKDEVVIAAVHNELMVAPEQTQVSLVLSGHFHAPKVIAHDEPGLSSGRRVHVRSGSIGGAGPTRKLALEAAVVDLSSAADVSGVHLVRVDRGKLSVNQAL